MFYTVKFLYISADTYYMSQLLLQRITLKLRQSLPRMNTLLRTACFVLLINSLILVNTSAAFIGIKTGDVAQNIVLQDLSKNVVNLSKTLGSKPVIIFFWRLTQGKTFYNYSLNELQFLNRIYDNYHEKYGLEIYGVYKPMSDNEVPGSELADIKSIIDKNKTHFPILIDNRARARQNYGINVVPSTVMINREGQISFLYPGFPITSDPVFTEQINALVGIVKVVKKESVK